MGMLDFLKPKPVATQRRLADQATEITLAEVLRDNELVEVVENNGDPFVIVTPRSNMPQALQLAEPPGGVQLLEAGHSSVSLYEIGSSSPSPFTSGFRKEYNIDLAGINGLQKYDMMRKSDGVVRGTLRVVKTPVLSARWFMQPATQSDRDIKIADFVWRCLTEYMSISFPQLLTEALLMCDFGYYMFEKVWEERVVDGELRLIWQKLAPRHPMDVKQWVYDSHGGPAGVVMHGQNLNADQSMLHWPLVGGGGSPQINGQFNPYASSAPFDPDVRIPIDKLLVFTFDREAGNVEGISVLRSAYKHHYYKEQLLKIDAIQKERHGIGIPIIKLPPGFSDDDKKAANELGRNLRTNERAHVVLPPNWDIMFAKLEGHVVDALKSVAYHDEAIRENVLAGFLSSNSTTKEEDQQMFLKATRFIADIVTETFNMYAIPELVDANFLRHGGKYPKLRARRIGEQADWRTMSFAVRNLIGAGVIEPDEKLEEHLRDEMDLPKADHATRRSTLTPQNPGAEGQPEEGNQPGQQKQQGPEKPGQPRQAAPSARPPRGNAGIDRSGG